MQLSRLILLCDDEFVTDLIPVYGVVYMKEGLHKQFPWWIRRFALSGYDYSYPDFNVPHVTETTMIGVPLTGKAHLYRLSIFGQRWIEDVNRELVSTFPPVGEVSVQGDDYTPDIDLMRVLQNV